MSICMQTDGCMCVSVLGMALGRGWGFKLVVRGCGDFGVLFCTDIYL